MPANELPSGETAATSNSENSQNIYVRYRINFDTNIINNFFDMSVCS